MPVPIVNVMVVVLRNSLAPINRIITNVCTKGNQHEKKYGFIAFRKFGEACYHGENTMNRFVSMSAPGKKSDKKEPVTSLPSNRQMFKIGVEWWSEIFIFYGILSAIAFYELGKYAKKARI